MIEDPPPPSSICANCIHSISGLYPEFWECTARPFIKVDPPYINPITGEHTGESIWYEKCSTRNSDGNCLRFEGFSTKEAAEEEEEEEGVDHPYRTRNQSLVQIQSLQGLKEPSLRVKFGKYIISLGERISQEGKP